MAASVEMFLEPSSIAARIFAVRGHTVMLDSDLAMVFEVDTSALNRAVKRNEARFPEEFAFQLLQDEWDALRCQIGISNVGRGGRRFLPWVFTEHGTGMLATVLNSERAIKASISVVDAFVRLHRALDANRDLAEKVEKLSATVGKHGQAITVIFKQLEELTTTGIPDRPKERIGFKVRDEKK